MTALRKLGRIWLNAEAIQLSFAVGAIFGMVFEAVLITVPQIAGAVLHVALHAGGLA